MEVTRSIPSKYASYVSSEMRKWLAICALLSIRRELKSEETTRFKKVAEYRVPLFASVDA